MGSEEGTHSHDDHVGQHAHVGDVSKAGVGGAVSAHETGTVHGKAHGQLLQRHVVHNLVIAALQE